MAEEREAPLLKKFASTDDTNLSEGKEPLSTEIQDKIQKVENALKIRALKVIYGIIAEFTVDNISELAVAEHTNIMLMRKIHELNDFIDEKMEKIEVMKNKNEALYTILKNNGDVNEAIKICESEIEESDDKCTAEKEKTGKKFESIHFYPEFVDSIYEVSPAGSFIEEGYNLEERDKIMERDDDTEPKFHPIHHCDSFTLLKYQGDFPKVSFYKIFRKSEHEILKSFDDFEKGNKYYNQMCYGPSD